MPTPMKRLTTVELNTLSGSTLGSLKPYELEQVMDALSRFPWKPRGGSSDVSGQPTITSIITSMGANNP